MSENKKWIEIEDLVVEGNVIFDGHVPNSDSNKPFTMRWRKVVALGNIQHGTVTRFYGYRYERKEDFLYTIKDYKYKNDKERSNILRTIREIADSKCLRMIDGEIECDSSDMLIPRLYSMFREV